MNIALVTLGDCARFRLSKRRRSAAGPSPQKGESKRYRHPRGIVCDSSQRSGENRQPGLPGQNRLRKGGKPDAADLDTYIIGVGKFGIKTQGDTWASLKMNNTDWIGMNDSTSNMTIYKNLTITENLTVKNNLTVNGEN